MFSFIFLFFILFFISSSYALDVSWLPTNPDAFDLPLSTKYRDNLRRLCVLVNKKGKIHPDIEGKKDVIIQMCVKLNKDEEMIANDANDILFKENTHYFIILIMSIAIYLKWFDKNNIINKYGYNNTNNSNNFPLASEKDVLEAREARLSKFNKVEEKGVERISESISSSEIVPTEEEVEESRLNKIKKYEEMKRILGNNKSDSNNT
jgi:hypothetical protein